MRRPRDRTRPLQYRVLDVQSHPGSNTAGLVETARKEGFGIIYMGPSPYEDDGIILLERETDGEIHPPPPASVEFLYGLGAYGSGGLCDATDLQRVMNEHGAKGFMYQGMAPTKPRQFLVLMSR